MVHVDLFLFDDLGASAFDFFFYVINDVASSLFYTKKANDGDASSDQWWRSGVSGHTTTSGKLLNWMCSSGV
jgi:hypothetical protein